METYEKEMEQLEMDVQVVKEKREQQFEKIEQLSNEVNENVVYFIRISYVEFYVYKNNLLLVFYNKFCRDVTDVIFIFSLKGFDFVINNSS